MVTFQDLSGEQLERWFQELIQDKLQLQEFYPRSGQIELRELDPTAPGGQYLEIDGVLLLNHTAVLMEFTSEQSHIKDKIRKFIRTCHLFTHSSKSLREKFQLFTSIPPTKLTDFEEVSNWRFAFFGTSKDIDKDHITATGFPDQPEVRDKLSIFGSENIEYIAQLTELINKYARYEFLSALDFAPQDLGQSQLLEKRFIKADNRYVTEDNNIKADIYLLSFRVKELLEIGRVSRYEGIPFALESGEKAQYQRFLVKSKLDNISKKFIKNEKRKSFPNTVTLVLSRDCRIDQQNADVLLIPNRYSSIDIIDGQHRIYAYSDPEIEQAVLEETEVLASAIKFQTDDQAQIRRLAAKIFCEINSNQAKVKNSLLYLIKYDVLGDKDAIALAGKTILECNKGTGALGNIFLINSLIKKNKLNLPPIPIVTIVEQDLSKFLQGEGIDRRLSDQDFTAIFAHSKAELERNPDQWWRKGKAVLEHYFNHIRNTFPNDWKDDSESNLLSSKYISALIRLLRYYLIDEGEDLSAIQSKLLGLKTAVNGITRPGAGQPSFPRENDLIPSTKFGLTTIYDFLKRPRRRWQS